MATSNIQRSLALLRKDGYTCKKVEHFNYWARVRQDLWGGDIIAIHPDFKGAVLIQVTDMNNFYKHRSDAYENMDVENWLRCGNRFVLHAWEKKKNRWTVREEEIMYDI